MTSHRSVRSIIVLAIMIAGLLGYSFLGAWTGPTGTPPNNNVAAPVNVGATTQSKAGNLVASIFAATTEMRSDRYCDSMGENCIERVGQINTGVADHTTEDSAQEISLRTTASCVKLNNEEYDSNTWMMCPQGMYLAGITDDAATAQDAMCCPFYREELGRSCTVRFVTWISGEEVRVDKVIYGEATERFAIGMHYWGDYDDRDRETDPSSLNYTEQIHNRNWGSNWTDSSETANIGYFNVDNYRTNKAKLDGYNSLPYIVTKSVLLVPSSWERIVNKPVSEIGGSVVAVIADVLSCSE